MRKACVYLLFPRALWISSQWHSSSIDYNNALVKIHNCDVGIRPSEKLGAPGWQPSICVQQLKNPNVTWTYILWLHMYQFRHVSLITYHESYTYLYWYTRWSTHTHGCLYTYLRHELSHRISREARSLGVDTNRWTTYLFLHQLMPHVSSLGATVPTTLQICATYPMNIQFI